MASAYEMLAVSLAKATPRLVYSTNTEDCAR